ncbi:MAG: DNA-binding protein [Planctomycetota bacterium]
MITQSRLLPVGPMARLLRVPVKWLRQEAEAGRVPCLKADKALLFDPDTVERVLLERAKATQQGAGR